ncbi:MAG: DUF3786 domain-containing protein [Deltaproteobacteria bacterium]|nr:DUF3786 domain-containing protein [Deltaproteobacteria bacterium]
METNYGKIIRENLSKVFCQMPQNLEASLNAERKGDHYCFRAFGRDCSLEPDKVTFSGDTDSGPRGLLVSLYGMHANLDPIQLAPMKAFRDLPDSAPYHGAFTANSEGVLVPHVTGIREKQDVIKEAFNGQAGLPEFSGDFSFILFPLPKIALCYVFYLPDDEFPASATCLFSANALSFMPLDGLADVAEYTSRGIIELAGSK